MRTSLPVIASVLLTAAPAFAQTVPEGPLAPPASAATLPAPAPAQPPVAMPPAAAPTLPAYLPAAPDDLAARGVLHTFARHARERRVVGGAGLIVTGAATAGVGVVADAAYDQTYGRILWIGGAIVGGVGILSLVRPEPIETLAEASDSLSSQELRLSWSALAHTAKRTRITSGVVNLAMGAVAAGAGAAVAAGAGDLDRTDRQDWTVALLAIGGGLLGGGIVPLFVRSETELGYAAAYDDAPRVPRISVSATPLSGGVTARW